jgi:hypothetical protein
MFRVAVTAAAMLAGFVLWGLAREWYEVRREAIADRKGRRRVS